jgi:hypothetical protein
MKKTKHIYQLLDQHNQPVNIDLNNYKVTCTITGARKSFYHKYLHNLIQTKYAGNIDTFRTTYVSRAARPRVTQVERLQQQIERTRARLDQLLARQTRLETETV